jgi:ribosomal RNA-processing protein 1
MSDKPLIQQALARELADLILSINPRIPGSQAGGGDGDADAAKARERRDEAALGYLRGFWECIVREWEGIDRLR